MSIPRITRGNDFTLRVRVLRRIMSGGLVSTEEIDLTGCTDITVSLVSRMGKTRKLDYTIVDNRMYVDFDETIPSGLYGFEVRGKLADGTDWRYFAKPGEFIQVVEATSDSTGIDVSGILDLTATVMPATLTAEMMGKITEAAENANKAAAEARNAVSAIVNVVVFMKHLTATSEAPADGDKWGYCDGTLYEAADGAWTAAAPEGGKIYVDSDTAQSYVSKDGALVRLDKENSDVLYEVVNS